MTIGPTGNFPEGRISAEDEGELSIAIAVDAENKVIRFELGKDVAWLAFPPALAREIGQKLATKVIELIHGYTPAWKATGVMSFSDSSGAMLTIKIGILEGQVKIAFEPEQSSFSMSGISANLLANTIIRKAAEIDGEVFTIQI
jgi:hypothetical protein